MDSQAQKIYQKILILLANAFRQPVFRAGLVLKSSLLSATHEQITYLFFLEKKFTCQWQDKTYAVAIVRQLANLLQQKFTLIQPPTGTLEQITHEYDKFINITADLTGIARQDLLDVDILQQPSLFLPLYYLSQTDAHGLFQQKNTASENKRPQATIEDSGDATSQPDSTFTSENQDNINTRTGLGDMFRNGFRTRVPDGNFPRHPYFHPKFYPFKTKPAYMPYLKYVLACICLGTSSIALIVLFVTFWKPIKINIPGWYLNDGKIHTKGRTETIPFILQPLSSGSYGFLFLTVIFMVVPGFYFGITAFTNNKIDRQKYSISYFKGAAVFAGALWIVTSIFKFLIPNSFTHMLESMFYVDDGKPDNTEIQELTNQLLDLLHQDNFFQVIRVFSAILLSLNLLILIYLLILFIINPRIDTQKMSHANEEYQKAVFARNNNQEYHMDDSLFQFKDAVHHKKSSKKSYRAKK